MTLNISGQELATGINDPIVMFTYVGLIIGFGVLCFIFYMFYKMLT